MCAHLCLGLNIVNEIFFFSEERNHALEYQVSQIHASCVEIKWAAFPYLNIWRYGQKIIFIMNWELCESSTTILTRSKNNSKQRIKKKVEKQCTNLT